MVRRHGDVAVLRVGGVAVCSILRTWPKFTHMTSCTSGGSSSKRSRAPSHWCETCKNARFEWSSIGPMMHTSYSRRTRSRDTENDLGGEGGGGGRAR